MGSMDASGRTILHHVSKVRHNSIPLHPAMPLLQRLRSVIPEIEVFIFGTA